MCTDDNNSLLQKTYDMFTGKNDQQQSNEPNQEKESESNEQELISKFEKMTIFDYESPFGHNQNLRMTWKKIGDFILTYNDRNIIACETGWLTDSIINAAQHLLAMKNHENRLNIKGLQNVLLNQIDSLEEIPDQHEFVQILLNDGNHWVVVSNVHCFDKNEEVIVYDSKSVSEQKLSNELQKGIIKLMPNSKFINYALVTQQIDCHQCGLYAIAFAECLCWSEDPSKILFTVNPIKLRNHLIECFEQEEITEFPVGDRIARFKRRY